MARIDKVVQIVRGNAGTAFAADGIPKGVAFGAGGSVVPSGTADADGILIVNKNRGPYGTAVPAGERVDVLVQGEVVEFGGTAGDTVYAGAAGALTTTNTGKKVGKVLDGGQRLVVNM
jgi:hypothetical protein